MAHRDFLLYLESYCINYDTLLTLRILEGKKLLQLETFIELFWMTLASYGFDNVKQHANFQPSECSVGNQVGEGR